MATLIIYDINVSIFIFFNIISVCIYHLCNSNGGSNSQTPDSNPFEEEEWDEEEGVGPDGALVDNGEPGVPVKALYDYEGAEADELSFKQGNPKNIFIFRITFCESLN